MKEQKKIAAIKIVIHLQENENDKSLKVQSPNEGSVMKPDLGHNNETMDDLKVHMPKGEQMTSQDKPKRLGQTKVLIYYSSCFYA